VGAFEKAKHQRARHADVQASQWVSACGGTSFNFNRQRQIIAATQPRQKQAQKSHPYNVTLLSQPLDEPHEPLHLALRAGSVMSRKVFIKTFGCQMNEYDSDKMVDVLGQAQGYEKTNDVEQADLIVFNTCSVREKAQEKVFSDLGRVQHLKAKGVKIAVGGCVASQEGATIIARAPYVDVVFGPQTLHRLPELLNQRESLMRPQVDISFPEIEKFDHLPPARVEGGSAYVSIMEGCSKYCSYCVVPYTRGEEVSRPFDDVLVEVAGLAAQGVKEVTLLGQNVNAYRGVMGGTAEIADFALLIEYVAEMPGIERIRYTTSHPNEFTQRLIDVYAKVPQLVSHLHLPVQHGSDRILMAMKRGYTAMEYKSTIKKLRAIRPDMAMSSDFIVGFPGETEEDHQKLIKLMHEVYFDNSFSFIFSPRPGTPAANLHDDTPHAVKLRRLQEVQKIIEDNMHAINVQRVGTVQRVLVDGFAKKDATELRARTECNRIVNFKGGPHPERLMNQLIDVKITEANPHSLRGEVWVKELA